jgi:phage terminase small subunit
VDEYIIDHNGVRAYLAAFGRETAAGRPRSYNAACVEASKLLKYPEVRSEIRAAERAIRRRCHVSADKVINELAAIAFSNIGDVIDFTGEGLPRPKPAREIPYLALKTVKSAKHQKRATRYGSVEVVEYALHPKTPALAKLYDHLGLSAKDNILVALLESLPDDLRRQVALVLESLTKKRSARVEPDPPLHIVGSE